MVEIFQWVAFYYLIFFACNVHTGNVSCLSTTQYGCGTKEAMLSGEKVIFFKEICGCGLYLTNRHHNCSWSALLSIIDVIMFKTQVELRAAGGWFHCKEFFFTVTSAVLTSISVKVTRRMARVRKRKTNGATITSFPLYFLVSNIALDQSCSARKIAQLL